MIAIIRTEDEPKPVMMAEFALTDRQAEAILNMRLRSLRRLEEMEIGKERAALAKEREELDRAGRKPGPAAQPAEEATSTRSRSKFGDERRTRIEEVAPAREIDWTAMIEKEPITVILSQRGWIRAMKGHLALEQVAELKWREGDGPFIHFHAQTTDRLALFASQRPRLHAGRRQAAERARLRRAGPAVHRPRGRGRNRRSCSSSGRR